MHHYRARLRHPLPRTLRRAVLARDGWTCAYCGVCSRRRAQVDHIRPVAAGGTDDMANLTCLCAYHNRVKSDYWPDPPRYHPRPGYANRRLARAILKAELADRQVTQ